MSLSAGFIAESAKRFRGEALRARLYARLDTGAGSDQLVELTAGERVIALSPARRERERRPGVMQAQQWSARITNKTGKFTRWGPAWLTTEDTVIGKWVALQLGYPGAAEWETFAQGRIRGFRTHSDGSATIRVADVLLEMVNRTLPRPLVMDERAGWVSPLTELKVASGSGSYNSPGNVTVVLGGGMATPAWERFVVRFASPTTVDIIKEDGSTQAGGPYAIAANIPVTTIQIIPFGQVAQIAPGGWTGTFSAGDEFVFYTSQQSSLALDPATALRALIQWAWSDVKSGVSNMQIPDVMNGGYQDLFYDGAGWPTTGAWADLKAAFPTTVVRGYFERNRPFADPIQGLLRIMNASLWPARTGQIGVWWVEPQLVGDTVKQLTGDPDDEPTVLEAERVEEDTEVEQRLIYTYRSLNFTAGQDGVEPPVISTATADVSTGDFTEPQGDNIDLLWACTAVDVEAAANRHLNRFAEPMVSYRVLGSLTNAVENDLSDAVAVTEPQLNELLRKIQLTSISVDLAQQEVELRGQDDPVVTQQYWILGTSELGTDTRIF